MTDQCGNPKDTGQQLMAANIGYDQTVTGLSAAHVQAAIDALYDITGLGYHPSFTGREEADQHPQSAITGLETSLSDKAATNHTQNATTVIYDNTLAGVLAAVEVQAAIDELATTQSAGVSEWSAVAVEVVPAEGIAASVNQMDWTGHAHADPIVPTALLISPQDIVTFSNGTASLYRWIGQKGVKVGLGGDYSTTSADYESTGGNDHAVLVNRGSADAHPQSAITDLVADQGIQDTAIGTNATDIGTNATNHTNHLADVANPHVVTAAQVGAEPANVNIQAHIGATNNPHSTTYQNIGGTAPYGVGGLLKARRFRGSPQSFTSGATANFSTDTVEGISTLSGLGTEQFTAPDVGVYSFNCSAWIGGGATLRQAYIYIQTPGAAIIYASFTHVPTSTTDYNEIGFVITSEAVELAASDVVECNSYLLTNGAAINVSNFHFAVTRIA